MASGIDDRTRILQHFGETLLDHGARADDVLGRFALRPGILRQSADHQHQAGGAERDGFVDGAAVIVDRLLPSARVAGQHAAAAIARKLEPGLADRLGGALEPDGGDLIAPR